MILATTTPPATTIPPAITHLAEHLLKRYVEAARVHSINGFNFEADPNAAVALKTAASAAAFGVVTGQVEDPTHPLLLVALLAVVARHFAQPGARTAAEADKLGETLGQLLWDFRATGVERVSNTTMLH